MYGDLFAYLVPEIDYARVNKTNNFWSQTIQKVVVGNKITDNQIM